MLVWARDGSRMDVASAAKRIGVAEVRLQAWENGDSYPTLTQLRKVASVYKRSVGVFFLRKRPAGSARPADFRRVELSLTHIISPALANGIRASEAKRESALDIYAQMEEDPPPFALDVDLSQDAERVAAQISEQLGISVSDRKKWTSDYDALNAWKAAVESRGVLVMQVSGVDVGTMRGCSLATFPLPVIILNSSDRPLGRVFTLLHELTHIVAHESSLCDVTDGVNRSNDAHATESFCNHVAGAILVPLDALLKQPAVAQTEKERDWKADELAGLRKVFWASREAILRRLLYARKTSTTFYRAERERMQRQRENDEGANSDGFVPFPRKVVLANGRFLTGLVVDAYDASVITGSALSQILGTKLDHLPKIIDVLKKREAA